ncbi:MAG: M23 family metallopeptidase [Spirochaetes bacterium]|nr:M23 family metallopeptidase [Spirochaetota bacterium]
MRRNTIKIIILFISLLLMAFTLNAAFKKEKLPEFTDEKIELLEDAIMIDSLTEESDSEDYTEIKKSFEDIKDSEEGQIFIVENFIPEKSKILTNTGDSLLKDLKKQDKRWHYSDYTIRKGDNLWTIGKKFNVSHKTIIMANAITNPDQLKYGKKIKIPNLNGIYYTVRSGDTLSEISLKYKTDIEKIVELNGIRKNKILVNSRIFIPDAVEIQKPVKKAVKNENVKTNRNTENIHTVTSPKSDNNVKQTISAKMMFLWPAEGKITSSFGMRKHPILKKQKFHNGIDIGLNIGTEVRAAASGKVIFTGVKEGYGNLIVIEHKDNYITVYAHLSEMNVKKDEQINAGEVIGLSGSSGTVTGPHLHFEIRKYLTPLNPSAFLRTKI